jgi:transcriptional regulator
MTDQSASDDRVLELREQGRSFSAIAKLIGYTKATEAPTAFNRALRRRTKKEQAALGKAEIARLDQLEKTVRADADLGDVETARKLKAVDRLRSLTLAP